MSILGDVKIGLGTAGISNYTLIKQAIEYGYQYIDTAQKYENEEIVGKGISQANVPRDAIVLATKVHPKRLSFNDVIACTRKSLDRLNTSKIDILYVHAPYEAYNHEDTLSAFEELYKQDHIDSIGLSNFSAPLLERACDTIDAPITANQIEFNPLCQPRNANLVGSRHNIRTVGFAPLMKGRVFKVDEIIEIAEKNDISPATVAISWVASLDNVIPIPGADSINHIQQNFNAISVDLPKDDLNRINNIKLRDCTYDDIQKRAMDRWGEEGKIE